MIKRIWFILECSRIFSVPMALFSWLVAFVYGFTKGGNVVFGILALLGIALGQLATNLFDDYLDYKVLSKDPEFLNSAQKSKCRYITDGSMSLNQTLLVVITYLALACLIGLILLYFCGYPVLIFAILGGIFILFYSKMSMIGLSEFAVFTAFGPILFGGVYWVMTQSLNIEIFAIAVSVAVFTVNLLYTHTLLDYDGDIACHKKTLCVRIGSKEKALKFLVFIWGIGYATILLGVIFKIFSPIFFITYLTIPYAIQLYKSLKIYNQDKTIIPQKHWYNLPFENIKNLKAQKTESFMYRLYFARNLMMYFSILMCIAIIIG